MLHVIMRTQQIPPLCLFLFFFLLYTDSPSQVSQPLDYITICGVKSRHTTIQLCQSRQVTGPSLLRHHIFVQNPQSPYEVQKQFNEDVHLL